MPYDPLMRWDSEGGAVADDESDGDATVAVAAERVNEKDTQPNPPERAGEAAAGEMGP